MISLCAKPFARGGGGTIATTDGHKPPTPHLPFFRTSHPPNNTDATQHAAIPGGRGGGPRSWYSGPHESRSADGQAQAARAHLLRVGFAQLTTSQSRLARTRHHRWQSRAILEFCDVAEFRCPGPTPSDDAASPVCPSRHHAAGYGQLPPRFAESATRLSSHHDVRITSPHYYILHRTHRLS